jgi:hypothetical protein
MPIDFEPEFGVNAGYVQTLFDSWSEDPSRVEEAWDAPATPPAGTEFYLIAGDAIPTAEVVQIQRGRNRLIWVAGGPGDGTVLRASALGDERLGIPVSDAGWVPQLVSPIAWRQVLLLFSGHLELTRDPVFIDNVLFSLLEDARGRAHGVSH